MLRTYPTYVTLLALAIALQQDLQLARPKLYKGQVIRHPMLHLKMGIGWWYRIWCRAGRGLTWHTSTSTDKDPNIVFDKADSSLLLDLFINLPRCHIWCTEVAVVDFGPLLISLSVFSSGLLTSLVDRCST
jgi:hypothetical protein